MHTEGACFQLLNCLSLRLTMNSQVAKFFLPAFLLTLLLVAGSGYGYDIAPDRLPGTEVCAPELGEEAEFGSSCYVDYAGDEAILLGYSGSNQCGENDGSWGTDAPEGFFSQDQPDDQSPSPLYSWRSLPLVCEIISEKVLTGFCVVHPGAVYPPPQR